MFAAQKLPTARDACRSVPYPSGDGLHVGIAEGYAATDMAQRMRGKSVTHPMGFDSFRSAAAAIKQRHSAEESTKNIANFGGN